MHAKTTGRKKSERYISKCRKRLLFVALPVFAALALATIIAALICGLGKLYPEEFLDNVLGPASAGILVALSALFAVTAVLLRFAQANEDAKAYDLTPYSAGEREKYDSVTTFRSYYAPNLFESDGTVELKGLQNFINYVLDMAPRLLEDADAPEKPYPADFERLLSHVRKESRSGRFPALLPVTERADKYDVVFTGSPNWCGTIAPPLAAWLQENDMTGKILLPFFSHCGGEDKGMEQAVREFCPAGEMRRSLYVPENGRENMQDIVHAWLEENFPGK